MSTSETISGFAEKESGVPLGTANHPKSSFEHWLRVVQVWWMRSKSRTVADEIRRFPLRILAIIKDPWIHFGYSLPSDPRRDGQVSLYEENSFLHACIDDIERLSRKRGWPGPLDQQLAAEAYRAGAVWAIHHNAYTEKQNIE